MLTAAFDAQYIERNGSGNIAHAEEILTIFEPSLISGNAYFTQRNTPMKLTSKIRLTSSSDNSSTAPDTP